MDIQYMAVKLQFKAPDKIVVVFVYIDVNISDSMNFVSIHEELERKR